MGFPITEELAPTDLQAAVIKRLRNSVRELLSNVTLRECGLALQRDFIKSTVWGSTQHLLAVTPTEGGSAAHPSGAADRPEATRCAAEK